MKPFRLSDIMTLLIAGTLSLAMVAAGKMNSDTIYTVSIFMYMHLLIKQFCERIYLESRLKKYKKAVKQLTEMVRTGELNKNADDLS